jgi:hypothetical protein
MSLSARDVQDTGWWLGWAVSGTLATLKDASRMQRPRGLDLSTVGVLAATIRAANKHLSAGRLFHTASEWRN